MTMRVLVVDDQAGMRCALEACFLQCNWQVDTAANAQEALELFRRKSYPLVVTDIRMPGLDGFILMHAIFDLAPNTAVILITEFANTQEAVSAQKAGACDYMPKPVNFAQLRQSAQLNVSARLPEKGENAHAVQVVHFSGPLPRHPTCCSQTE
jgi:DNA-binding NtrC family response regulator